MNKNRILTTLLAALMTASSGCAARWAKPRVPAALNRDSDRIFYKLDDFRKDYDEYSKAYKAGDLVPARRMRDAMIDRIRVDIEMNYREYESLLFFDRAKTDVGGDFLELALGFATTITNGERAKSVLAAVLTGVQGTKLSFDKNFFREKTTETIIAKMEASRDKIKNRIVDKMVNLPPNQYPFEEAWADLTEFFYAGTLQGGIQALANDAGSDAVATKKETEQLDLVRTATTGEIVDIGILRAGYIKLYSAWESSQTTNSTAAKTYIDQAKKALTALNVSIKDTDPDKAILDDLNQQIRDLIKNRDRLPMVTKAFRDAGIIN